jgi:hypothetical protein
MTARLLMLVAMLSASCDGAMVGPPQHLRVIEKFTPHADRLRSVFDSHFESPRQAHPMRFVWDYWHVPEQYTLHRTQAASYFDEDDFNALTDTLTTFGQTQLGCRAISPPVSQPASIPRPPESSCSTALLTYAELTQDSFGWHLHL